MLGRQKLRILFIWLSRSFWGIGLYRLERGLYLTFGGIYKYLRVLLLPLLNLVQAYSNVDIHYQADIKQGILILHPSIGIVISGKAVIGSFLTLTGGNTIGIRKNCDPGKLIIGNNCSIGANAVILGPIQLGDNISVGALSCVLYDCLENNSTLVGVPAKVIKKIISKLFIHTRD